MCHQRHKKASFYLGTTLVMVIGLGLLVFATDNPLPVNQTIHIKGNVVKPNPRMEPRYELAPGARNPFLPSTIIAGTASEEEGNAEKGKAPDVLVPTDVSAPPGPTDVAAGIRLQAVFSKKGKIWGIFNGQPVEEGSAFKCNIKGVVCDLIVVKIEQTPPRSVLRFGEAEFSCELQSPPQKRLK